MTHLLAVGYGFSARAVAQRLIPLGWCVSGTGRRERIQDGVTVSNIAHAFDRAVTHILVSVPPNEDGDETLNAWRDQLHALPDLQWVGYLSTVGVYGDHQGAWVDEETPLISVNARSKWRAVAELQWLSFAAKRRVSGQIFRLAGIYGPGRSPLDRVRDGRAQRVIKPGQVFNRIHVTDIAAAILAGIQRPNAGPIFNVTDDEPAPPQDVIAYAVEKLGLSPLPDVPFEQAELSPMARSFYRDNKRVSNTRIKNELGVALSYPNYRVGIDSLP